jgi:hypothetical protein
MVAQSVAIAARLPAGRRGVLFLVEAVDSSFLEYVQTGSEGLTNLLFKGTRVLSRG